MRNFSLIAILLLIVGCSKDINSDILLEQTQNTILHGVIDDEDNARVYLDNKIRIRWNSNDLISAFVGTTRNLKYQFMGEDGEAGGDFDDITPSSSSISSVGEIDRIYALYPYNDKTKYKYGEDDASDYIHYPLSAEQTYKANSIGLNSNIMVAITSGKSDGTLIFRNVCSYLRVKLYGVNQKVTSIVFKGNSNEVLSGNVAITPVYDGTPTIEMLGAITDDNKTITLNCTDDVMIGSTQDTATEFWMVVPPLNFPKGFTITVYGNDGKSQEYVINSNLTFARNTYNTITRELTIKEDYYFNENHCLYYRANSTGGWDSGMQNYHRTDSYIKCGAGGYTLEMKFKLKEFTSDVCLAASSNLARDYSDYLEINNSYIKLNIEEDDDNWYTQSWKLSDFGVSSTDLITLILSGETITINGTTKSCEEIPYMGWSYIFSNYYRENDEGIWEVYEGVPEGSELYYAKLLDKDGNLVYVGHPKCDYNDTTGKNEYYWYSNRISKQYANDYENKGGYTGNF